MPSPGTAGADRRGRLTIPDIARVAMVLAVIGALWPVAQHGLETNADVLSTGTSYLFLLVPPLSLLVLLVLSYRAALGGG